eukprot:TRINITY_DN3241_c0_g1_i1.p2 TRINITY_DN3241_c0_g1~~TRINITY_DN3241_c0_g1_i1.p2  ORF type:complete len:101 (-),score=18.85 TRINITY_DN3241_c0_g1_i1:266-568(-)
MCEAVDKARATLEGVHANVADIEADIRFDFFPLIFISNTFWHMEIVCTCSSLVGSNQTLTMGWDEFGYFVRISGIGSQRFVLVYLRVGLGKVVASIVVLS